MKASLIAIAAMTLASTLTAQPAPKALPQQPSRKPDPAAFSNMLAHTGGMVQQTVAGPSLLLLNTQKRVAPAALEETADLIKRNVRLSSAFQNLPSNEPVAEALKALANPKNAAVVVIADVAGYPSLLIAPESRWALVNVAALGGADSTAAQRTERTQKEVWRAFGYLMGAANSNFEHCLMKSVITTEDLDALKPKTLCPEPYGKIVAHAQKLGMKPSRMTTYRKAVEEGWAAAPTNDFQRAIWAELKK